MKKINLLKEPIEKKTCNDIIETAFNEKEQLNYMIKLYMNQTFDESIIFKKNIKQKISGYRSQDILKKRLDNDKFITYDECIEKLVSSKLHCYYCKKSMLICYKNIREPLQWTLDRFDNNIGHYNSNVCVCCLQCNLQRRVKNTDHFKFTKQLKINKL
tara:strand:+ start:5922 stop:6395 length:474 start_codon:yes stop_codon:yes gene_type:complete